MQQQTKHEVNSLYAVMHRLGFFFFCVSEELPVLDDFPFSPDDFPFPPGGGEKGRQEMVGLLGLLSPSVGLMMVDDDGTNRPPDAMADERAVGIDAMFSPICWCFGFACTR